MPQKFQRDRFDAVTRDKGRVGAHRAENPKSRAWAIVLWAVLATAVLFAGGLFATLVAMDKITFGEKPVASAPPTQATEARIDTSYSVLILNATTNTSNAETVKKALIAQGWKDAQVTETRAKSTDFPHTTVYYALNGDAGPALGLAGIFKLSQIEQSTVYQLGDADQSPQLTIVIGADFPAAK